MNEEIFFNCNTDYLYGIYSSFATAKYIHGILRSTKIHGKAPRFIPFWSNYEYMSPYNAFFLMDKFREKQISWTVISNPAC